MSVSGMDKDAPKGVRFAEFLRRLEAAESVDSFEEAYCLLAATLNEVENELTSIPYDPANWQTDGRMYPPQMDNLRDVEGCPLVKRLRSRAHNTFIGENGSIEIQSVSSREVIFSKRGRDDRGVWDL